MKRSDALARLREHEAELKQLGVQRLYLFGSTARGDARDDSDVIYSSITRKKNSGFSTSWTYKSGQRAFLMVGLMS